MESSSFCNNYDKYIDISPTLHSKIAVFPGDTPFVMNLNMSFQMGEHLRLSDIKSTVHAGAHADAPCHYHPEGEAIDKRSLSLYMGPCQVIAVSAKPNARIYPHDLADNFKITGPRILFKTQSFPNPDVWNNDFNSLSAELIFFLHKQGVLLVGIDTPSVDPATDKQLSSHLALYQTNMAVLEGLVLNNVSPGNYDLIALPLKIKDADASPVRAILIPPPTFKKGEN